MTSKRRIRRKSCIGKTRFKDAHQAQRARRNIDNPNHYRFNVYKCPFCHGYHVGRAPGQKLTPGGFNHAI